MQHSLIVKNSLYQAVIRLTTSFTGSLITKVISSIGMIKEGVKING